MVVRKSGLWQHQILILNILLHQTSQKTSQIMIDNFSLTISLWMISCTELKMSSKLSPKCMLKMTYELGIPIRSDYLWDAMKFNNLIKV
jgi:hypothetical protein